MRLVVTPLAERDIESIADYISRDSPSRALTFITGLRQQCERITSNPQGYRERPELGPSLHSCTYGNYVIFFQTAAQEVTLIRVLHSARDVATILARDKD